MLSRREFLELLFGTSIGIAGAATGMSACRRDTRRIVGNLLGQDFEEGHALRDAARSFDRGLKPGEASERISVAIVGGGPAGLAAAWRLRKHGLDDFRVYELEDELGGTSRAGRSHLTPYPWAAHYLPVPRKENVALVNLLDEMQVLDGVDGTGEPRGAEPYLVRDLDERIFYRGFWYPGLVPTAGLSVADREELARFAAELGPWVARRNAEGRRAFDIPLHRSFVDEEIRALDGISGSQWLDERGYRSKFLRWFLEYGTRDDYGLLLSETSAWAMLFYEAARATKPGSESAPFLTWPEGNGALVAHLSERAGMGRTSKRALVYDIEPVQDPAGAIVRIFDLRTKKARAVHAQKVIVATPRHVAWKIVRGLDSRAPSETRVFSSGAWVVANIHMKERPTSRGAPLAWDNVLHRSPSVGYVCATHQRGRDVGRTVLTYYLPLTGDAADARRELLRAPYEHWRDAIVADLSQAHPRFASSVERLDVWRWGHAMAQPRVGCVWARERIAAREPLGPVHFAHSDLSGVSLFEEAFAHGVRAADEVKAAG